jgi:branched-chain amino acid transport system ATP-binding protein
LARPDILRSVFLEGAGSVTGNGNGKRAAKAAGGRAAVSTNGAAASTVLAVHDVARTFGGVSALDGVSLELHEGQILGLIGPNGAGKTTLFDVIGGFLPADRGRIELDGTEINHLSPQSRAWLGLGRSFQDARLFPALTVADTIAVALERQVQVRDPLAAALHLPAVLDSERAVAERVDELVELLGLQAFRDKFVSELSTGSRRIVDLACTLAHEPRVLLLDEPSSGIAQRETEALGPVLLRIREQTGASLLVIEHDMTLITSIADELLALDLGRVIARGRPADVVRHPDVVASYLGSSPDVITRSGAARPARRTRKETHAPLA